MLDGTVKSLYVDDSQTVGNLMVLICTKIGITNHDEYSLVWDKPEDVWDACGNCSQLQVNGAPSINNIQIIVMGVINNSQERIYGKVLVNELRMTGVKKRRGRSYGISG